MKKHLIVLSLILAAMLCLSPVCRADWNWDTVKGTQSSIKVTPEKVQAGYTVTVNIRIKNCTDEDLLSPVILYDPDGNRVESFSEPVLKAGEIVTWSGLWKVTEAQVKDYGIRYTVSYRYRNREGVETEAEKTLRQRIYPDRKGTPEPTPEATPEPTPRPEDRPRIILYSVLQPDEETGLFEVCCIDEAGDMWSVHNADIFAPYPEEEIIQLLLERRGMKKLRGNLNSPEYAGGRHTEAGMVGDLKALAEVVQEADGQPESTGTGRDVNAIYAMQYDEDGRPKPVLLGACGGAMFENKDPNAQALYDFMWKTQDMLTPCGVAEEGLTPHGFEMISARQFFGLENVDAETVVITAAIQDCETGPIDVELTEEDRRKVLAILERGVIIGKENPWLLTGGTMCYYFQDAQGEDLGCIETYEEDGLAVGSDGMYRLSLLPESTENLTEAEKELLHLKIGGTDCELGKSTPRDLIRSGWYCYREFDGSYAFSDDKGYGDIYVYTRGDGIDEPIISVNNQFAYSIPVEYCGFDGKVDPDNPEDPDTAWRIRELEKLKAEIRENGEDIEDYNLSIDPFEGDDEDERGDGLYWLSMKEWILTLGERDEDSDNGMMVRLTLSDGHTLSLFTAESPVSLSLGDRHYIRLGPDED